MTRQNFKLFHPEFKTVSRKDYDDPTGVHMPLEFWNRKCYLCKEQLWQHCVDRLNDAGFNFLCDWGGIDEGYGLFCNECFEKFIHDAHMQSSIILGR